MIMPSLREPPNAMFSEYTHRSTSVNSCQAAIFIVGTRGSSAMAHFVLPNIPNNADGWGPSGLPEQFKDMPYQPFSKADRLGKVCLNGVSL